MNIPECPQCGATAWQITLYGMLCYHCGTPMPNEELVIPPNIILGEE